MTLAELRLALEKDARLRPLSQQQRTDLLAHHHFNVTLDDVVEQAVEDGRLRRGTADGELVYLPVGGK